MPAYFRSIIVSFFIGLLSVSANAADPVRRMEKDPHYQLSNLRRGEDNSLLFNFKRLKKASGYRTVFIKGKSNGRLVSITATINPRVEEDIVTLRSFLPSKQSSPVDIELYLVTIHTVGDKKYLYSMVSNPVRIGDPGEQTKPREWTTEERQGYAEYVNKKPTTIKRYEVNIELPAGSVKVPLTAKLTKGQNLQACYSSKWSPITTLSENPDGSVFVRWDDWGESYDCNMLREELLIKKSDLARLQKHPKSKFPEIHPSLAKSGGGITPESGSASAKPLKAYPVSISVPADSQLVPADATLQQGTKLQACYASKWNPITLLAHAPDGTLVVRWDDYGESFDCRMKRDELIIKKALLQASAGNSPNKTQVSSRVWTDSTGQFKVSAKLVSKSENVVTLLTDKGKTVELPLSRLSEVDRNYLSTQVSESDNPFE